MPGQFFRGHAFGDAGNQFRNPQVRRGLHHGVERVHGGHDEELDVLAFFFSEFDNFTE